MFTDSQSWADKYDRAAQDFLENERVLAAVQVARTGGWRTMALSMVSGLGTLISLLKSKKDAGHLPQMFLLAVTDEHLCALGLPRSSTGLKPRAKRELARWERSQIEVATERVVMGVKFVITLPDGAQIACQGPEGELSERVARALELQPGRGPALAVA
ncbi:MAG TPA: hypothetical protein VIL49_03845 [Capillimicrobium sp.]|jgi:hypothetical protein